jgi:HK97 gp10 family phage protein
MNDVDIQIMGMEQMQAALKELDYKTQHRFIKRVVNDAANIYVKAAKRQVPVRRTKLMPTGENWHPPGTSKKSIMKKAGKSRRTATVFVGPRGGPRRDPRSAWYLKFPEYGTVKMAPMAWFRIAYAANKQAVEDNMIHSMRKIITRIWNKQR